MKMLHKPGKSCVERSKFCDHVTGRYRWIATYQGGYLGTYETWDEAFEVAFGVVLIDWDRRNKIRAMHAEEAGVVIPDERLIHG
jgi:hypothetical protein